MLQLNFAYLWRFHTESKIRFMTKKLNFDEIEKKGKINKKLKLLKNWSFLDKSLRKGVHIFTTNLTLFAWQHQVSRGSNSLSKRKMNAKRLVRTKKKEIVKISQEQDVFNKILLSLLSVDWGWFSISLPSLPDIQ